MIQYYSQKETKQDQWIIEEVFPDNGRGFFVDIGAADGIRLSNTYALEQMGWSGICVEPRDDDFLLLQKNRPQSQCVADCIGHANEPCEFVISDLDVLLSGVKDTLGTYMGQKVTGETVTKNMITLTELLTRCEAPHTIEYISIDTEGNEYDILRFADLNKYRFKAITIEHNYMEPMRSQILVLLDHFGYKRVREATFDDFYLHKELL